MSASSFTKYRELVEQPGFVSYFRLATPVDEVEQLPIGSRPARRRSGGGLSDLRAIPWVFSWTQCRRLIPAWYGLGTAMRVFLADEATRSSLQSMYREWPFFAATIDNAELALAKTDLGIAQHYASLGDQSESFATISKLIADECEAARDAILAITERTELLDGTPWLKESIRVRNRYIDPLNVIQVELLKRMRSAPDASEQWQEEMRHLARLTVNGIAAGTCLFIWFTGPLAKLVDRIVPPRVAPEGISPKFLDEMLLEQPAMALDQVPSPSRVGPTCGVGS